ncbi:hypothetical protein [Aquimarina sp. 2201CG5-10]|uniref:hypothetical protein n=1 Tax=Aquimarina callyspongiae TaxID=3098150 RepID=UPI002AB4EBCE|nr:hypothetical protein [Aquimarina sp. 2201CG5-10]MDY8134645.1 hypothetical protein [Aquimarina sp. 2201CG5-10]
MKLHIENKKGTFEVIGNFTAGKANKVKDHFNYLLDHYEEVVMCLKKVKKIDKKATQILNDIYQKSCRRSKVLFILGKENQTVVNALQNNQLSHIFRNDY